MGESMRAVSLVNEPRDNALAVARLMGVPWRREVGHPAVWSCIFAYYDAKCRLDARERYQAQARARVPSTRAEREAALVAWYNKHEAANVKHAHEREKRQRAADDHDDGALPPKRRRA